MATALASTPDAIGLISWNEFSENTHVEPSEAHGASALRTLADIVGTAAQVEAMDDSSSPGANAGGPTGFGAITLLALTFGAVTLVGGLARRRRSGLHVRDP
jgi:hypothetical protein